MADVKPEMADLKVLDGTMVTFDYRPSDGERHPAIIVIQEVFGVNDNIQGIANRFAAEGYATTAPDLFHRTGRLQLIKYGDMDTVAKAREGMTDDGLVEDLKAVVAHLQADSRVDPDRIGIVGYCMGGRVSFLAAARVPGIAAAAVYYGGGIVPREGSPADAPRLVDESANVGCPVVGFWGGQDQGIPAAHVDEIEAALRAAGKDVQMTTYPDAGHGFFCDDRQSYNEAASADAWPKTLAFFGQHLKGATAGAR